MLLDDSQISTGVSEGVKLYGRAERENGTGSRGSKTTTSGY